MSANSVNSLPRPELSEQTAVIVVDVQNDFCHNDGALGRRGTPMDRIQATVPRIAPRRSSGRSGPFFAVGVACTPIPFTAARTAPCRRGSRAPSR